jgi:hypothetical protein
MADTHTTNEKTGEKFPRKSRGKNGRGKKFFGWRYGDATSPNAKKGIDFINDGYPLEVRHKSVIKQKIQDDLTDEELLELL